MQGGHFEHTLPIRGGRGGGHRNNRKVKDDEDRLKERKHYDQMANIVEGKNEKLVKRLDFEAGTLSIFQGSECLHRVTKVQGNRDRLVAVLCYGTKPGIKNSKQVQKMFWGRSEK